LKIKEEERKLHLSDYFTSSSSSYEANALIDLFVVTGRQGGNLSSQEKMMTRISTTIILLDYSAFKN
jgi:hypothetical protein